MSDQKFSVTPIIEDISDAVALLERACRNIQRLKPFLAPIEPVPITDVPAAMKRNKERVKALGLSMFQVCRLAGINQGTWISWSNRDAKPTLANWERLMATLAELGVQPVRDEPLVYTDKKLGLARAQPAPDRWKWDRDE